MCSAGISRSRTALTLHKSNLGLASIRPSFRCERIERASFVEGSSTFPFFQFPRQESVLNLQVYFWNSLTTAFFSSIQPSQRGANFPFHFFPSFFLTCTCTSSLFLPLSTNAVPFFKNSKVFLKMIKFRNETKPQFKF